MKPPQISIVLPVYNAESYLSKAIESILNQTKKEWELIVVDDGSTDQSCSIVKKYTDSRIKLCCCPHDFIASLNKGVEVSSGKYIVRMDADDVMLPNRLQTQWEFMETHPEIDICGSWAEVFGEGTGIIKTHIEYKQIISSLLLYNTMLHPTVILRRTVLSSPKLYKYGYPCAEDYKLWTDLAIQGFRFANIPETLLQYRSSNQQVTYCRQKEMVSSTEKIRLEYAERVIQKIVQKEERYKAFFNSLIELANEELITGDEFMQTVYQIFIGHGF